MKRFAAILLSLAMPAVAQWHGEHLYAGIAAGFTCEVEASGNHRYLLCLHHANVSGTGFAASSDGGRTWSSLRAVAPMNGWRDIAANGRSVVIAVQLLGPGGGHGSTPKQPDSFYVEVSQDGGQSFQRTTLHTPNVKDVDNPPAIAFDGNDVWVFWGEDGKSLLQHSADRGVTWRPTPLVIPNWIPQDTFVADSGRLFCLDRRQVGNGDQLFFWRSLDGGATWSTTRLDPPGTHALGTPRLVRDRGTLIAAWVRGQSNSDAWVSVSSDDGTTWSGPRRASVSVSQGTGSTGATIDLAASAGRILVAYSQAPRSVPSRIDVYASTSTDGGQTFTAVRLNQRPATSGYPMLWPVCALAGERSVVAWIDEWASQPNDVAVAAVSRDGGATWSGEQPIFTGNMLVISARPIALAHNGEGGVTAAGPSFTGWHVNSLHQPWLTRVGTYAPGQSVSYRIDGCEASDEGAAAVVGFSLTGPGTASGGLPLPGGRRLLIDPDPFLFAALSLGPIVITGPITNGSATTTPLPIPPGFSLGRMWAAAIVSRVGGLGSMTDTIRAN